MRWFTSFYVDSEQVCDYAKSLIRQAGRELAAVDFAVLIDVDPIFVETHFYAHVLHYSQDDHNLGRFVKKYNFMSLLNIVVPMSMPIAVALMWENQVITDTKTSRVSYAGTLLKSQLLQAVLRVALPGLLQHQFAYRYQVVDRWYDSAVNRNTVHRHEHECTFALTSSQTVAQMQGVRRRGNLLSPRIRGFPQETSLVSLATKLRRGRTRRPNSSYKQGWIARGVLIDQ